MSSKKKFRDLKETTGYQKVPQIILFRVTEDTVISWHSAESVYVWESEDHYIQQLSWLWCWRSYIEGIRDGSEEVHQRNVHRGELLWIAEGYYLAKYGQVEIET